MKFNFKNNWKRNVCQKGVFVFELFNIKYFNIPYGQIGIDILNFEIYIDKLGEK